MRTDSYTAQRLGRLGLSGPISSLSSRRWDTIVVGAGHNGLTCAAYLARAKKRVLVLESRERVGGACTIEEPWPGVRLSPCAYLAGLLHPLVVAELGLVERGFKWTPASNGLFVPFDDGSSVQLYDNEELCEQEIARLSPRDVKGWRAMSALISRLRDALRPAHESDMWIGDAPTRKEIECRVGGDVNAMGLLFEWSIEEFVARYLEDERLQIAYLGQGVIGTNASPFDPGTASIRFHHASGRLGGLPGAWGYVQGGMGMVSFLLCDAALEAGAVVVTGTPVTAMVPGEGVVLAGGERIPAPVTISNADPVTTLGLLGTAADEGWRERVNAIPMTGCTVKLNVWLRELPNFRARPGVCEPHHFGQLNTPLTKQEWRSGFAAARQGRLPERLWTEIYFQSVHDRSIVPGTTHAMSMFCQYVPYRFAEGSWADHRERAKSLALDSLARYCSNVPDVVIEAEALGPPDIESKVGLTGGHIFQGECLPQYMWSKRLAARTPMRGIYLCGAGTHPGGSVIAINGRNAAMAVLADTVT
ncbi:MAG TPA: NAD(P)/FAD-dependent oxidoreductase [Bryobacteraceae bacterium]|nr:NAD(P)/FAD-dependent oxidoreductase [Bryobacteraceae bacterium]